MDAELQAIHAVVAALTGLSEDQRVRALEYVLRRFNVNPLVLGTTQRPSVYAPQTPITPPPAHGQAPGAVIIHDIRTLKEAKGPKSANEMAALVAFYVSELAPQADRKPEITAADIERYFKAAGFALPADANFTLVNAKNAGYLESVGRGQYKLNPVGYNLVAHRMENRGAEKIGARPRPNGSKRRGQAAKKTTRAKK
jgi:hypothetical protein